MKRRFATASLLVLALAGPAAATCTWLGSDTNWNNTANWSGRSISLLNFRPTCWRL